MSEKRKIERLSPLVIRAGFSCGEDIRHGYLTNLSEAGAFLATDELLEVGHSLTIDFVLPWGLGKHTADASVVWLTGDVESKEEGIPAGVGLSFANLTPEARESVRRYMQRFHELVAQIEVEGLAEVVAKMKKLPPTIH